MTIVRSESIRRLLVVCDLVGGAGDRVGDQLGGEDLREELALPCRRARRELQVRRPASELVPDQCDGHSSLMGL